MNFACKQREGKHFAWSLSVKDSKIYCFPFAEFHGSYVSQLLLAACISFTPLISVRLLPYIKAAGFMLKL